MKNKVTKCLLFPTFWLFLTYQAIASSATLNIAAKNFKGLAFVYDPGATYSLDHKDIYAVQLDNQGRGHYLLQTGQYRNVTLFFRQENYRLQSYTLFISSGDNLNFNIEFNKNGDKVTVSGKGSNNNQPDIYALTHMDVTKFNNDTIPDRIIQAIDRQYILNQKVLDKYIIKYKPSIAFVENCRLNLIYFKAFIYFQFNHDKHLFQAFTPKWQGYEKKVLNDAPINNVKALNCYNYLQLVGNFIERQLEWLQHQSKANPIPFYKKWYGGNLDIAAKKFLKDQHNGIFHRKVINNLFNGKVAEYAYADLIRMNLNSLKYAYIVADFNHFKGDYPKSEFIKPFEKAIDKISQVSASAKILFPKDNGTRLNSFSELLAQVKGRTIFVDMWGTWCEPCRSDIANYSFPLRNHFKNKNISFFYIANHDVNNEIAWHNLVKYFNMEGTNILANDKLTKSIMTKIGGSSFPTYFIIKKDGTILKTKNQDMSNLSGITKEIDDAL